LQRLAKINRQHGGLVHPGWVFYEGEKKRFSRKKTDKIIKTLTPENYQEFEIACMLPVAVGIFVGCLPFYLPFYSSLDLPLDPISGDQHNRALCWASTSFGLSAKKNARLKGVARLTSYL